MNKNELIIPCRLSYAHIYEPAVSPSGGEPKYSVCLLIPKSDTKTHKAILAQIEDAKKAGASKWGGKIPTMLKTPLRDGDAEREQPEYEGCWFLNASHTRAPKLVDRQLNPVLDRDEIYSGCYANVKVSFFAYNANGNRGIGCGLEVIQKTRDGERLGGSDSGLDGFEPVEDGEGDDFL